MDKEYYIIKRLGEVICPYYMKHGGGVGAQFTGTFSDARQFSIEDAVSMKSTLSKSDKYEIDICLVTVTVKPVAIKINVTLVQDL